ncbi:E3 ubiquitin-protein ligase DCST1 [Bufo gargarizans]|uniref:E3 ubiquitin-protein ligase DCST1 n=1 Tax=Bufo gargarizans TaxID=30331 RepID=UPI001CF5EBDB|nr:E3 ubiquitin-protein ligase DCST1 [Bufo gargarizans]
MCFNFLYSDNEEFKVSKFFLGASFGAILGLGVYFLLVHPMNVHEEQKINIMYGLSGTFAFGWATSSYFRCSTLILAPNLLGKEGRTIIVIGVIASIYAGPVANIQKNVEEIVRSVSCTVDLQINHTKVVWKEMTKPMKKIVQDLVEAAKELKNRSSNVVSLFKEIENEVESTEGYSRKKAEEAQTNQKKIRSTQKKLELKTMLRCEYVVELGISKCKDWFAMKHEECMRYIFFPVLNSLLCLPMKFTFVCNIMYLVNRWCKSRLPLEGNFGQVFEWINNTVYNLNKGFSSTLVVRKEEQSIFGVNISQISITEEVIETLRQKQVWVLRRMQYINTIMSCMFIFLFTSAFNYTIKYNTSVLYDNFYVTTYFRQIDAHRRKLKKKYLLPLRNLEKADFVFPFNLCVQKCEMKTMMMELVQCAPFFILFILTMGIDQLIIHIFHIIHKHFHVSYFVAFDHKLQILVGGDTLLARLLQHTVAAFNSSFRTVEFGDNKVCLPNPAIMSFAGHVNSCMPTFGLLSLCFLQVYVYRLRRVIASFFFPKREKCRVLYLYNSFLLKRRLYFQKIRWKVMGKSKRRQIWEKTFLGRFHRCCRWTRLIFPWRCIVCEARRSEDSFECRTPGCCTVYCRQCWWDLHQFCWACIPYENYIKECNFEGLYESL